MYTIINWFDHLSYIIPNLAESLGNFNPTAVHPLIEYIYHLNNSMPQYRVPSIISTVPSSDTTPD